MPDFRDATVRRIWHLEADSQSSEEYLVESGASVEHITVSCNLPFLSAGASP